MKYQEKAQEYANNKRQIKTERRFVGKFVRLFFLSFFIIAALSVVLPSQIIGAMLVVLTIVGFLAIPFLQIFFFRRGLNQLQEPKPLIDPKWKKSILPPDPDEPNHDPEAPDRTPYVKYLNSNEIIEKILISADQGILKNIRRLSEKEKKRFARKLEKAFKKFKDPQEQQRLLLAVGTIGPEASKTVPLLIKFLKASDRGIRYNAVWALGQIGPKAKKAIPALKGALTEEDEELHFEVKMTLKKVMAA